MFLSEYTQDVNFSMRATARILFEGAGGTNPSTARVLSGFQNRRKICVAFADSALTLMGKCVYLAPKQTDDEVVDLLNSNRPIK